MDGSIVERILDLAVQIQQIPSPTFEEGLRAKFIYDQFLSIGPAAISVDDPGNISVCLMGRGNKPPLVVSAHLDTVFPLGTALTCTRAEGRISGPGIGDNSLGLAGLFGLYWYFSEGKQQKSGISDLPGDIWLVGNVGEEGLGNLKGMKSIVDRFGNEPSAYLVLEGMPLGQIYTRGLGVRRYRIHVHTRGGHSWVDYGRPSAIHEIAELVVKIKNMPMPIGPRSSLNIGIIKGGTSVNTIASDASLELDLRSESSQELTHLVEQVEQFVKEANDRGRGEVVVQAEVIGDRPGGEIPTTHPLVRAAIDCYTREGIPVKLNIGSTDANVPLSRGYPAICLGLTNGGGSHTTGEYIETAPLDQGFRILVNLVRSIFRMDASF